MDEGQLLQEDRRLGEVGRGRQSNGKATAELRFSLGVSIAQPFLQHLRRARRLSLSLPLGKEGDRIPHQGHTLQPQRAKIILDRGLVYRSKFGRADEHKQFRRLFQEDKDFHALLSQYVPIDTEARGADQRPDNWLTSRLWYEEAYDIVETRQAPIRGKSPHIFYSDGPKALMNYANTIETEGVLDEKAQYAWRRAGENWATYGNRVVPTSWGTRIRLNDEEAALAEAQRLSDELDKLVPGLRKRSE